MLIILVFYIVITIIRILKTYNSIRCEIVDEINEFTSTAVSGETYAVVIVPRLHNVTTFLMISRPFVSRHVNIQIVGWLRHWYTIIVVGSEPWAKVN